MLATLELMAIDPGLAKAIAAAGNRHRLAKLLGLTEGAVRHWTRIPINRVIEVEKVTNVRREELRPDFFRQPGKHK
jgi:DNA-binding transcriptional regulator YdaS (Cro superfamily)